MRTLLHKIDLLRVFALILLAVPALAVFALGMVWLWQTGNLLYWATAMVVFSVLSYGLLYWQAKRDRQMLEGIATEPNPDWPPKAEAVWQQVEKLAETCNPEDWPIEDSSWILVLGRRTLDTVSHYYYPQAEKPFLELTVPHTLLIIEQASRDLRKDITENIPFSDRLTIGDLLRLHRWKAKAEQAYNIYRAGRILINPMSALFGEIWRHLQERSFSLARSELHRWFLRAYVRKVGYYAIDLYSGRQPVALEESSKQAAERTPVSHADLKKIELTATVPEEPLRILVLGRTNAGKSSLINALFGKLTTATDVLPDTTETITPFVLQREGLTQALIFDSPGCDSTLFNEKQVLTAALNADLILWVSPANRPDRQTERHCLDALRVFQSTQLNRRLPPILVAVSHIDLLRPASAWQPPYDLSNQQDVKAISIRAAVQAIANDLAIPIEQVIPVCLKEGRVYNVNDALWAAILHHQNAALRVRLLRCLDAKKRAEDWTMLRRQLLSTGRFLWNLPDKISKRSEEG
ncbi:MULTISPECIES: GTPase family protein [Nitrosomonas]|uniref:GTP-binding protein HSR1 n=1 Tax=Nitrosomonas communis TaxID=44574 RepID=A0A0F7KG57_9PROT|nr:MULTISPECIES: GTPase [Nitrosomonas]AKH38416.1 GTP-binding protein HSR1 [Nitrosomonas communis]TYP78284.1 hypothetical protein BCL69_10782 [Nitrosomonas communis]UVS60427.1 50S ribosome-binding GTPase [Nitrosomonas sp. PLL12]SDW95780.1 hypothetical protein SAMN05421882_104217 [Nitrosomonas communis]